MAQGVINSNDSNSENEEVDGTDSNNVVDVLENSQGTWSLNYKSSLITMPILMKIGKEMTENLAFKLKLVWFGSLVYLSVYISLNL